MEPLKMNNYYGKNGHDKWGENGKLRNIPLKMRRGMSNSKVDIAGIAVCSTGGSSLLAE